RHDGAIRTLGENSPFPVTTQAPSPSTDTVDAGVTAAAFEIGVASKAVHVVLAPAACPGQADAPPIKLRAVGVAARWAIGAAGNTAMEAATTSVLPAGRARAAIVSGLAES